MTVAASRTDPDRDGSTGRVLPQAFADFRDFHAGETIVVCGCGTSLRMLERPDRFVTIGVNDVGRLLTPDYLLVVNTRHQFAPGRFAAVEQSGAKAIFTHLDLGLPRANVIRFALGRRGGTDFSDPGSLNYTRNSPYPAVCLAMHMGAKRIGLIGVDFTEGHFFGATGQHPLARELPQIDAEYRRLREACSKRGVELVNLSAESRLTALHKTTVDAFAMTGAARQLRIVSYATTPVAGVPAVLGRAIAHATPHDGRTVWADNGYGNGVVFDGDVEYRRRAAEAAALLDAADVVVVHNGKVEKQHRALVSAKPVITMAHNYMWNVDPRYVADGYPGLVVGQYQATLPEFADWTAVPNPIPLWDATHAMGDPTAKSGAITICYLPSAPHERFPPGHRLFWHAKGYRTTMAALDSLVRSHGVRLEVVRRGQVSHVEAMAMKRRAHIVIDECATGSYHRTSLEGLAAGAVVLNGIGQLAGVADLLRLCAGGAERMPFVTATLETLHDVLAIQIARGPEALIAEGRENRAWMEKHWNFGRQWTAFWMPAVERALARKIVRTPAAPLRAAKTSPPPVPILSVPRSQLEPIATSNVTVIVPLAGGALPTTLALVIAALEAQQPAAILIVESGTAPTARETIAATKARYIFAPNAAGFDRVHALNVGLSAATTRLILWCDADLLLPEGFIAGAVAELERRRLDHLVPWTSIRDLAPQDIPAVIDDTEADARAAIRTRYSRHGETAGIGLVRAAFVRLHGGLFGPAAIAEEAFLHMAGLFARAAVTNGTMRHAYRLLDPAAPANDASAGRAAEDRRLIREIRGIGSRARFLARFPPSRIPLEAFPSDVIDTIAEVPAPPDLPMNAAASPLRLNLGCGDASVPDFVNVDRHKTPNVDQQADLAHSWPWADDTVEAIRAFDIIEHLPDKIHTMNELWRVLRPGGQVEIAVPTTDGPGAFQDPTHVSFWHRRSFLYYEKGNPYRERFAESYGIRAAFRIVRERIDHGMDGPRLTILLEAVKE